MMMETASKWETVYQIIRTIVINNEREELARQKGAETVTATVWQQQFETPLVKPIALS